MMLRYDAQTVYSLGKTKSEVYTIICLSTSISSIAKKRKQTVCQTVGCDLFSVSIINITYCSTVCKSVLNIFTAKHRFCFYITNTPAFPYCKPTTATVACPLSNPLLPSIPFRLRRSPCRFSASYASSKTSSLSLC